MLLMTREELALIKENYMSGTASRDEIFSLMEGLSDALDLIDCYRQSIEGPLNTEDDGA